MTNALKFGNQETLCRWLQHHSPFPAAWHKEGSAFIGVYDEKERLLAVVAYTSLVTDGWTGLPISCEMSIASISPRWASRKIIVGLLAFAFNRIGVGRVTAITSSQNIAAQRFLLRCGFVTEGIARKASTPRNPNDPPADAIIFGMLREEFYAVSARFGTN